MSNMGQTQRKLWRWRSKQVLAQQGNMCRYGPALWDFCFMDPPPPVFSAVSSSPQSTGGPSFLPLLSLPSLASEMLKNVQI